MTIGTQQRPPKITGSEAVTGRVQDLLQQLVAPQAIHLAVVAVETGGDTFRWSGATGSWLFYCPELDVYLAGTVDQVAAATAPFRFVPKLLHILASVWQPSS